MSGIKIGKRKTHHFLEFFLLSIAKPIFDSYKISETQKHTTMSSGKRLQLYKLTPSLTFLRRDHIIIIIYLSLVYSLFLIFCYLLYI